MQGVTIKNDHPHWFERHHLKSSIAKISHDERFRVGIVMLLVLAILTRIFHRAYIFYDCATV